MYHCILKIFCCNHEVSKKICIYCPLLCLSAFDRHEGGRGLANEGANYVGSKSVVPQKFFIVKVLYIVLRCSATIVKRWRTIIRRSDATVLHLKF